MAGNFHEAKCTYTWGQCYWNPATIELVDLFSDFASSVRAKQSLRESDVHGHEQIIVHPFETWVLLLLDHKDDRS